jgi:hypothetical protein
MLPPKICCYRLTYRHSYDEEAIWAFVQRHQGYLSIRQDCIDFYLAREYTALLLLSWPSLEHRAQQDLY